MARPGKIKIALIQQKNTANRDRNMRKGLEALEKAAAAGAKLIVFPELSFLPFLPQRPVGSDFASYAETIPGPTTELLSSKAVELGVALVFNLLEIYDGQTYDSSPVIDRDGRLVGLNRMVHVLEAPGFHEKSWYQPGNLGAGVFETSVGVIGVAICYDRHFPEYTRALALKGAELVVIPQAGVKGEWPEGLFEAEIQVMAFQNGYFCALANRVGKEETLIFDGGSLVADPFGQIIGQAKKGEEQILLAEIDFNQISSSPARKHFLIDRRPDIYDHL